MKSFHPTKVIRRAVVIKASDRAIPAAEWSLTFSAGGVTMRKLHARESHRLTWRSVIGYAVVHGAGLQRDAT